MESVPASATSPRVCETNILVFLLRNPHVPGPPDPSHVEGDALVHVAGLEDEEGVGGLVLGQGGPPAGGNHFLLYLKETAMVPDLGRE